MLAVAGNATAEMNVGEHRDAGLVEQALAQLLRIGAAGLLARLGDVGPRVEGAARRLAAEAGHLVEQPTIRSRRSRNDARIASAASCGPLIASTAAHWLICEAHESVLVIQRVNTGASARLAT